jgi:hypothetical protein
VLYYATPSSPRTLDAICDGVIGYFDTPSQGQPRPDGVKWMADNGCFGSGYPGDEKWIAWLTRNSPDAATCAFATAPDVVANAQATLDRSAPWLAKVRNLGYKVALVGQDGMESLDLPWDDFDAFFIGGSTLWKLGSAARELSGQAKDRGKHLHMGRVNSLRRYRYAEQIGCDSVDGTFLAFGPDKNLPQLLTWAAPYRRVTKRRVIGAWGHVNVRK